MKNIFLNLMLLYTPGFNGEEAKNFVNSFVQPLTSFLLWAVPVSAIAVCLLSGIGWFTKDEEEKERKPFIKSLKPILYVTLICESITVIFKIFGL